MTSGPQSPVERLLSHVLERAHLMVPDELGALAAEGAGLLGATEVTLHLVDHDQVTLMPLRVPDVDAVPLVINATLAGRAFIDVALHRAALDGGGERVWVPVVDGVERLGVLGATFARGLDEATEKLFIGMASLFAEVITARTGFGDVVARTRRTRPMSLQAELLWQLLPPLTVGSERVVVSGVVEPAYDVGGDAFDYALNGDEVHVAIFDGLGHGLQSGLLSTLVVTAYRHARRQGADLLGMARAADAALAEHMGPERFATAVLCSLDAVTGRLSWVNAGHPAPLLLRDRRVVKALDADPSLPLGLADGEYAVSTEDLQPGDRVVLYTDGVVEARTPDGEFFGVERLVDLVVRESAAERPAPETLRRVAHAVLAHQGGALQDDATTVLVEWRTATVEATTPS